MSELKKDRSVPVKSFTVKPLATCDNISDNDTRAQFYKEIRALISCLKDKNPEVFTSLNINMTP